MSNWKLYVYAVNFVQEVNGSFIECVPYKTHKIDNVSVPRVVRITADLVDDINAFNYHDKFLVEVDGSFTVVDTKHINSDSWLFDDITKVNEENATKNPTMGHSKVKSVPVPEDVIISKKKWDFIVASVLMGKYVLLNGPTGVGKTVLARALARCLGYDFYYINCGTIFKPKATLVGTVQAKEGSTFLVESEFMKYFKSDKPTLIFLDEISRIPKPASDSFMTILDKEQSYIYVEELAERVYKGSKVIFIAAANFGMQYVDTRKLDSALMNRFVPQHVNYLSESDEINLLKKRVPGVNSSDLNALVKMANVIRKNEDTIGESISHRRTIDMAEYLAYGFSFNEVKDYVLLNLFVNGNDDKREQVEQILNAKNFY